MFFFLIIIFKTSPLQKYEFELIHLRNQLLIINFANLNDYLLHLKNRVSEPWF